MARLAAAKRTVGGRVVRRIAVTLGFPPTLNNLFANVPGVGRVATKEYRLWQAEASLLLLSQRPGRIEGRFRAVLTFRRPDNHRRDLDNLAKPVLDALVKAGAIDGDHLAEELVLRWSELSPSPRGSVTVELEAMS